MKLSPELRNIISQKNIIHCQIDFPNVPGASKSPVNNNNNNNNNNADNEDDDNEDDNNGKGRRDQSQNPRKQRSRCPVCCSLTHNSNSTSNNLNNNNNKKNPSDTHRRLGYKCSTGCQLCSLIFEFYKNSSNTSNISMPMPLPLCNLKRFEKNTNVDQIFRDLTCFQIWHTCSDLPVLSCCK